MPTWLVKYRVPLLLAIVLIASTIALSGWNSNRRREQLLADSWAQLEPSLTGEVGLVVMPVGGRAEDIDRFGQAPGDMAWSTAKVPIAIAADMAKPESASVDAQIHSAITVSDNNAAARLWSGLGDTDQARTNVDALLAQVGDTATRMGTNAALGQTYTGYTTWRLEDQALFTSGMACTPSAQQVLDEMKDISPDQRWGLGKLDNAAFKSGWGRYKGHYTSRQMGLMPINGELGAKKTRTLVVTMTVENPKGSGRADLDAMAAWVQDNSHLFRAGACRR